MRFPMHVPDTADDGRRPRRFRLAALTVATVITASAALAAPFTAAADEGVAEDAPAIALIEEPAGPAEQPAAPAEEPAEPADAPAEEPAAEPADAAAAAPTADRSTLADVAEEVAAEYDVEPASGIPEASARLAPAPAEFGPNLPPVAVDDHFVTVQDQVLVVDDPGLLVNDSDPEGEWFAIDDLLGATPGEMTWWTTGAFTFTPPTGFVGTRTFTYQLRDDLGAFSNVAGITIEVVPTGGAVDLPPIANDDVVLWATNTPLYIAAPGVLANDVDADGDPHDLTVSLQSDPFEGSVAMNADGSFLFTPEPDHTGTYWFTYRACDATTCADAEVKLEPVEPGGVPSGPSEPPAGGQPVVDLPPVAQPDTLDAVAGELATFPAPGVLGNDSDPEGQPLELVGLSQPAHGVIYHWTADGTVQYVPNDGFAGTDQVTYTVSDGTQTATSTLTFTVTAPANSAPQAWEDEVTVLAGGTVAVDAPGVLGNDSDQDGDELTVTWAGEAQHGTGAIAVDGSFAYTPDAGFTGTDYVGYEAGDGTGTDSAILIIHVIPADAPAQPSVIGDHYTAMSGALLEVPAPGVLGNDLAPSGPVSVVGVEPAQHGSIAIDPDGSLSYTSDAGYTGVDTVRYTITDGTAQADGLLSITVLGSNGACAPGDAAAPTVAVAAAVPAPLPGEPCDGPGEPAEPAEPAEPGEPGLPAEPGRPADPGSETRSESTDASALARTGADAGLAATVAALLAALGVALRLRRRGAAS